MLPDFPKLRIELSRRLHAEFKREVHRQAPLLAQIKVVAQHEGKGGSYETEDGEIKSIKQRRSSVPLGPLESGPAFGYAEARSSVAAAAAEMGRAQTKMLFERLDEEVAEVGNSLDAGGQPLSAEMILSLWDRMQFDFDRYGRPKMPTLVFNPIHHERVDEQFKRLATEPKLIKLKRDIMNRKRLDWDDRESRRKLVD